MRTLRRACSSRARYHAGAVGSAVDQIAEQHDRRLGARSFAIVVLHGSDQRVEQVQASVHVPYDIDTFALRHSGARRLRARAEHLAKRFEHRSFSNGFARGG